MSTEAIPTIVGILNITKDSFSDGGNYLETDAALTKARSLYRGGADIVELGPASSNPMAESVSVDTEINRISPLMTQLRKEGIPFSLDSCNFETQCHALEMGACMINDIRGFEDPRFYSIAAQRACKLVLMHSIMQGAKAEQENRSVKTVLESIYAFFSDRLPRLLNAGIRREQLVLDPGMGFFLSSRPEASIAVLQELKSLQAEFQLPLFLSVSRKSFLRKIAQVEVDQSSAATLTAELFCYSQGVAYIRTHDPRALSSAFAVQNALLIKDR